MTQQQTTPSPQQSQQLSAEQQKVIELMQSLNEFIQKTSESGYSKSQLLSALLNMSALVAVEGGAKGKEFANLARRLFNEMRDAVRQSP